MVTSDGESPRQQRCEAPDKVQLPVQETLRRNLAGSSTPAWFIDQSPCRRDVLAESVQHGWENGLRECRLTAVRGPGRH